MRRYLETLFSYKELFLIPVIFVPVIALLLAFQTGHRYTIESSVWVDTSQLLEPASASSTSDSPSETEGQTLREWLATEAFRSEVMDRTGLTAAINVGRWPVPSPLGTQLAGIPVLNRIGRAMNITPPRTRDEAYNRGLTMVRDSIIVEPAGNHLLKVRYEGPDPFLGQRLVEEVNALYDEGTLQRLVEESQTAVRLYTQQAEAQRVRMEEAAAAVQQFLQEHPEPPFGSARLPAEAAELETLRQTHALAQSLHEAAQSRLEDIRVASESAVTTRGATFRVIDPPQVPDDLTGGVSTRAMVIALVTGLAAGVLLGLTPIILMTWLDGTVRTPGDLEGVARGKVVAQVPAVSIRRQHGGNAIRRAMASQRAIE